MAVAVLDEYLDNAIVAMGPSSYNTLLQDIYASFGDFFASSIEVETTPPDSRLLTPNFFESFASLER